VSVDDDIKPDKREDHKIKTENLNLRLLLRQVLAYVPGSVLPAFIGLASAAIFTRVFSTEEYGRYSLVVSVATLGTALASQWLQQAINRYLPGALDNATRQEVKRVAAMGVILISGLLGSLTLIIVLFRNLLPDEWKEFVVPGALLMVTTSAFNSLSVIFQAEMRAKQYSFYILSNSFGKLIFSLLIIFTVTRAPSGMVWGAVLSTAILLPILWYRAGLPILSSLFNKHLWSIYWSYIKQFASYGFPMIGWFLAATLLNVGDRYVIQWFRGSAEVGIYSANYNFIQGAVGLIAAPILLAAHPFLMRAWGKGDRVNAGRWLEFITEWFAIAGIVLVGATWLFSSDLATWFLGTEFRAGHVVMPVVIAGIVAWQLGMYAHKPLEFSERTGFMFILSLAAAGLNLILNIIFVPMFGYVAAAYTTLISYLFYTIITSIAGQRDLRWRFKTKPIVVITVITAGSVLGLNQLRLLVQEDWGYGPGFMMAIIGYAIVVTTTLKLAKIESLNEF
jgi:O-antigen/teichoic acid export membrane protein